MRLVVTASTRKIIVRDKRGARLRRTLMRECWRTSMESRQSETRRKSFETELSKEHREVGIRGEENETLLETAAEKETKKEQLDRSLVRR